MATDQDLSKRQQLEGKYGWLGPASTLCATVTSFWLLYVVFQAKGFLATFVTFFFLGVALKLGPAPMFAVAASILCFYFNKVDMWLPLLSYVVAAVTLYVTVRLQRAN